MKYVNPVICQDFSDPDVIRVGGDFYMVASSFNYVPAVPVLHSENLVEWEIINYVLPRLPFERFDNKVCHGNGAWAVSIRRHNGKFYCLIPFPDDGVYVCETEDIRGEWSAPRPLFTGKGYEDPCPIWTEDGRCYVVFAFAKSRAGFNSVLGLYECDCALTKTLSDDYTVIFDGRDTCPKIEGPKIYKKADYYYILAPAGGVKTGWQVALRSKNIYGPYEHKVILAQGDTDVNGPHQGALVDLDDEGEKWAFMHFQDAGAYGRVVHLQPAVWVDDWVLCGNVKDGNPFGEPVLCGDYPVDKTTGFRIADSDEFDGKLNLSWQTPANPKKPFVFSRGLKLNAVYSGVKCLIDEPEILTQKVPYFNFSIKTKCKLNLKCDGDEAGFCVTGREYSYICVVRSGGQNYLEVRKGVLGGARDETLCRSQPFDGDSVTFQISAKREHGALTYKYSATGFAFAHKFTAVGGVWTGARVGIYTRSTFGENSTGYATFKFFKVTCTDNRVKSDV